MMDDWLMKLQRMGRVAIHAPSSGQEAAQIGSTFTLSANDWAFPTYRELPVYLSRGATVLELFNRWMANSMDRMKGHDFAIYGDVRYKIMPGQPPIAVHIPPSVGFALAAKIRRENIVVLTFFGDGATSKGDFHEAVNFAGVFRTPNVFLCQNNQWAISLPLVKQTAAESIAVKAAAYGFEGVEVDGNDVLAVYKVTREAVEKARRGEGPTLIEAKTYRLGPHTTADDPRRYREDSEVEEWRKKDPIIRFRRYLEKKGYWDTAQEDELSRQLQEEIERSLKEAEATPPFPSTIIFEDTFAELPWHLREQLQDLQEHQD